MRFSKPLFALAAAVAVTSAVVTLPTAGEDPSSPRAVATKRYGNGRMHTTDQIMVRLRDPDAPLELSRDGSKRMVLGRSQALALSRSAVTDLQPVRQMASGTHVLRLARALSLDEVQAIADRLSADPAVESAAPDARKYPSQSAANDTRYSQQWSLWEAAGGLNVETAWTTTLGANTIVAVLDTGIVLTNPDLVPTSGPTKLLPGYDMVSADPLSNLDSFIQSRYGLYATANDGDGRESNPSDPGNWVAADEAGKKPFADCPRAAESDWHGTHISGIIGAIRNNAYGVAGVAPSTRILPVRVLGKCGGYTSDIVDGIRWAAGLVTDRSGGAWSVANANPAQVINLSLGGPGSCTSEEQSAITAAIGAGVKAIVTAAGNDGLEDTNNVSPANCTGVIVVAATDRSGSRAPYTNIGTNVTVTAPGGCFDPDCPSQAVANGIMSLFNTGTTVPLIDGFAWVIGTSEAAAHASGVAALMIAANPAITAAQVSDRMKSSARPFPDCTCTSTFCGGGMLDAARAVTAATGAAVAPLTGATCAGNGILIGTVYLDANGNNALDSFDDGIQGVTVSLQTSGGTTLQTTTTNDIGNYAFSGLAAGTYRVVKTQPAGGAGESANVGSAGGTASANTISGIVLTSSTFAKNYNFALTSYNPPSSSGGGGGGGGGGCTAGSGGEPDLLLAMLALLAVAGVARRRRAVRVRG